MPNPTAPPPSWVLGMWCEGCGRRGEIVRQSPQVILGHAPGIAEIASVFRQKGSLLPGIEARCSDCREVPHLWARWRPPAPQLPAR